MLKTNSTVQAVAVIIIGEQIDLAINFKTSIFYAVCYSCSSLGIKIGGAFGTAICGWILGAAGYIENAAVQTPATVNTLYFLYLWAPIIICVVVMFLLSRLKVEKANAQLLKTQDMTDDDVPTVYGNV